MSDNLTPSQRHCNMAAIQSASTKPEIQLRHALWHRGLRYRKNVRHLPGSPDIVLPKYKTVIFVHGCFWHGHKGCKYYTTPKTNTEFWTAKIARNQERDQQVWRDLESMGWSVVIVWECQLKRANLQETIDRVELEIREGEERWRRFLEDRRAERERVRIERKKNVYR